MKIVEDRVRYDNLQAELVDSIADAVRGHVRLLLDGRVPADLNEVTSDIVSSITSILDGSDGGFEAGIPMITFATAKERRELVIPAAEKGPGCMNMRAAGIVPTTRSTGDARNARAGRHESRRQNRWNREE